MSILVLITTLIVVLVGGYLYLSSANVKKKEAAQVVTKVDDEEKKVAEEQSPKKSKKQEKSKKQVNIPSHESMVAVLKGGRDSQSAGGVLDVASSDKYIATVRESDHYIRLWKTESILQSDKKNVLIETGSYSDHATACAISQDSKFLAYALEFECTVVIYDISNEKSPKKVNIEVPKQKHIIRQLKFSSDSKFLVSSGEKSDELIFWKVPTGEIIYRFSTGTLQLYMFDIFAVPESINYIISCASFTTALKLYNIHVAEDKVHRESSELKGHSKAITCLSFNPTKREVMTASQDNTIKIFTTLSQKEKIEVNRTSTTKLSLEQVVLYSQDVAELLKNDLASNVKSISWLQYISSDTVIALSADRRNLIVLSVASKQQTHEREVKVASVIEACNSEEKITSMTVWSSHLVTGDSSGIVRIWKL